MIDNPDPDLETVRGIVEQIEKGLRAFHRMEMLHQDLQSAECHDRQDRHGPKIIDFGSVKVAGVIEAVAAGAVGNGNPGHGAVYGTGIFHRRRRLDRGPISFRLPSSTYQMLTGQAALRRPGRAGPASRGAADGSWSTHSARHAPARPAGVDGRGAEARRVHPDPVQALRGAFGVRLRSTPTRRRNSCRATRRCPCSRAQPACCSGRACRSCWLALSWGCWPARRRIVATLECIARKIKAET